MWIVWCVIGVVGRYFVACVPTLSGILSRRHFGAGPRYSCFFNRFPDRKNGGDCAAGIPGWRGFDGGGAALRWLCFGKRVRRTAPEAGFVSGYDLWLCFGKLRIS